jgi:hypothetical protein
MPGNEGSFKRQRRMVIQERDRHLLRELSIMRVIDRELAKIVGGFGSTTRANARLLALVLAGLLHRFFLGTVAGGAKALYTLSEKGARLVEVPASGPRRREDQAVVADFFIEHQLAINKIYCALKYGERNPQGVEFKRWVGFSKRPAAGLRLIPDGYVEIETPRAPACVAGQGSELPGLGRDRKLRTAVQAKPLPGSRGYRIGEETRDDPADSSRCNRQDFLVCDLRIDSSRWHLRADLAETEG